MQALYTSTIADLRWWC